MDKLRHRKARTDTGQPALTRELPKAQDTSERAFAKRIIELAQRYGWSYQISADGWRRKGHTPGFPDVTLVKGRKVIFAELKTDRGYLNAAQKSLHARWLRGGRRVRLWRPSDWAAIEAELGG